MNLSNYLSCKDWGGTQAENLATKVWCEVRLRDASESHFLKGSDLASNSVWLELEKLQAPGETRMMWAMTYWKEVLLFCGFVWVLFVTMERTTSVDDCFPTSCQDERHCCFHWK